ncbi:MAG: hypothetical protein R2705_14440 [Ilumatobacteraceae bacterium]
MTQHKKPLWRRWWAMALGGLAVLGIIGAIAGGGKDEAVVATASDTTAVERSESTARSGTDEQVADSAPPDATEAPDTTAAPSTTQTTEAPTTTAPASGVSLAAPAAVGEVVQVGDWAVRVVGVVPDAAETIAAENQFNDPPAAGKQFFMASLEATYTGSGSSTFWWDMTLKAVGASNVAYESGFDTSCGVIPNPIDEAGEVFPGGTIIGNACWAIDSTDAASLTLLADASFSFDNDDRRFLSMDPAATPVDGSTTAGAPVPQPPDGAPLGESFAVGDWTIKVVSATPDAASEIAAANQFNDPPAEGHQFFLATVEATYTGSESSTFWLDMDLRAVGGSAVTYSFNASCGVIPNPINDAGETFPGGTITGNVCWSVTVADAGTLRLLASESFSLDEDRAVLSLV